MFQKMSEEEIERRSRLRPATTDAEQARKDITRDQKSTGAQNNPLHPDTASEFSERYGGSLYQEENYNPSASGIQNSTVERKVTNNKQQKRKKIGILRNGSNFEKNRDSAMPQNHRAEQSPNEVPPKTSSKKEGEKKGVVEKSLDAYGRTAGRGLITSAYIWTNFIYLTFQVWLGIIAVVAIGIVFAIEYHVGPGITQEAFNLMMAAIGVDWDFYLVATLCYMLVVATCYIQLFGVAMQAKALGLHPLGGGGAFLKTGSFLLCFILYCVPIFNCLPLVNIYIASIQAAPR